MHDYSKYKYMIWVDIAVIWVGFQYLEKQSPFQLL